MKGSEPQERLLVALAEQLKVPLMQIARQAEQSSRAIDNAAIITTAESAIRLIDSYLLVIDERQAALSVEPVSVGALMYETAEKLATVAKQYGCDVDVQVAGRYAPVMANRQNLQIALEMLGTTFIQSTEQQTKQRVVLGSRRNRDGTVIAGVFSMQGEAISAGTLKRSKALYGSAQQPFAAVLHSSGAGVFIADSILKSMATPLKATHFQHLGGLAATLLPSQQLHLGGL
jgi:choline dehydrogenase-like flavoprotein